MSQTDALLRELISEVRALRETVAAAHARSMVNRALLRGVEISDEKIRAALADYFQEVMTAGRPAEPPAAQAAERFQ